MLEVRYWEDVTEGMEAEPLFFPITVHRLVLEAGGNRDFATVHHNKEAAQATGAPDCFANNAFVQGMFERLVREFRGLSGIIRKIGPFRMQTFLMPGRTAKVTGEVTRKWLSDGAGMAEISVQCAAEDQVTAAGKITVILPLRAGASSETSVNAH
jgi:hypothetical protein